MSFFLLDITIKVHHLGLSHLLLILSSSAIKDRSNALGHILFKTKSLIANFFLKQFCRT